MEALREYLSGPFQSIQGWCSTHVWQATQAIHTVQTTLDMNGPIAEIGVHRGKSFIGLVKTKGAVRGNLAIDVFDLQQFNIDKSGKGSRELFAKNLTNCGIDRAAVEILHADTLALSEGEIARVAQDCGSFSLFSVDGGHTVEHVVNDVRIAMRLTAPEGVILVDDYHNGDWPGVHEGIAKLFLMDVPRFAPFLFSCGVLFLAHVTYHKRYVEAVGDFLRQHHPSTKLKKVTRFGYEAITAVPDFKAPILANIA